MLRRKRFTQEFKLEAIRLPEQGQQGNSTPTPISHWAPLPRNIEGWCQACDIDCLTSTACPFTDGRATLHSHPGAPLARDRSAKSAKPHA